MTEEKEEWDGPWKEAVECLDLVFVLFWPDVAEQVDPFVPKGGWSGSCKV